MRSGTTVAIIVDNPSRWTPVREALPILLKRLHDAGVRSEDVSISVGVGRPHAVDAEAMRRRVGAEAHCGALRADKHAYAGSSWRQVWPDATG